MSVLLKAGLGLLAPLALLIFVPAGGCALVLLAVALVMGTFLGYIWLQEVGPADGPRVGAGGAAERCAPPRLPLSRGT